MYWDETFTSWAAFGVSAQPTAILFDAAGEPIQAWAGPLPTDEVVRRATESN